MKTKFEALCTRLGEVADFDNAAGVLSWDQQTYMPSGAAEARAQQSSTLSRTAHERFVADEIGELLDALEPWAAEQDYDSFEASLVRVARRNYDKARRIPADLVARRARAGALAHAAWEKARPADDFAAFQPYLEKNVDLNIELAEALGYEDRRYDALLDRFEPEMKAVQVEALFSEMKEGLRPLVAAIAERQDAVDASVLQREYDEDKQWAFVNELVGRLGFDWDHGRQDRAAHPFTTSFTPADVRLTTRIHRDHLQTAVFASIHETGHALYDQGVPLDLARTPLGTGASSAVHESQSRMWENIVGRSLPFWHYWLPRLRDLFPAQLEGVTTETFYRAINRVQPSLIRVEADEATYNMHIFLRFEIENLMLEQEVSIAELPELWNARMEAYLGIRPDSDRDGVLQDVHWAGGMMGYFPTYALGNLLAAQFYTHALADLPGLPEHYARGEFAPLLDWLRSKIHVHGSKLTPEELVQRVTGGPISTGPFLAYVRQKYSEIYGL